MLVFAVALDAGIARHMEAARCLAWAWVERH